MLCIVNNFEQGTRKIRTLISYGENERGIIRRAPDEGSAEEGSADIKKSRSHCESGRG